MSVSQLVAAVLSVTAATLPQPDAVAIAIAAAVEDTRTALGRGGEGMTLVELGSWAGTAQEKAAAVNQIIGKLPGPARPGEYANDVRCKVGGACEIVAGETFVRVDSTRVRDGALAVFIATVSVVTRASAASALCTRDYSIDVLRAEGGWALARMELTRTC